MLSFEENKSFQENPSSSFLRAFCLMATKSRFTSLELNACFMGSNRKLCFIAT